MTYFWNETRPIGDENGFWRLSAMSSNGKIILCGEDQGDLHLSTNGGVTWNNVQPPGASSNWGHHSGSMSSNGSVIMAGIGSSGRLYLSTDTADNWDEIQPAGDTGKNWRGSSMSSDGSVLLIGHRTSGRLYLSTDTGTNWNETQPVGNVDKDWIVNSMSSDGSVMIACSDRVYLSTNGGSTWNEIQPAGDTTKSWSCCAMSSDGSVIIVGVLFGHLYLSTNGGSTWSEKKPAGINAENWNISSMSSDGSIIVVGVDGGRVYLSTDTGSTWDEIQPVGDTDKNWYTSSMSSDGNSIFLGVSDDRLYLGKIEEILAKIKGSQLRMTLKSDDPESEVEGSMYYNTTDKVIKYYDGTQWIPLESGGGGGNGVPVGTVQAWLKNYDNTPALSSDWVECNGQTLSDAGSPFNGQVIPDLNGIFSLSSTATSGDSTTITDSGASWEVNKFTGYVIELTGGTGTGQIRKIVSNTSTVITIDLAWTTNPSSDTTFTVYSENKFLRGNNTSGNIGGFDTHNHRWTTNEYSGAAACISTGSSTYTAFARWTFRPDGSHKGTEKPSGSSLLDGINYTDKIDSKPPFYNVVWIMKVK
jgi:photosystem II stability/assembly factor-like uncharacterized protein